MLALSVALVLSGSANLVTTSQQVAHVNQAIEIFLPTVRACGPSLLKYWGLKNTHKDLKFLVSRFPHRTERMTVAGTKLNGESITLFPRFFDLTTNDAALVLIHEWLHTQGLRENPPSDTEINKSILQHCDNVKTSR